MIAGGVEVVLVEDNPNHAELTTRVLRKNNLGGNIVVLKDGAEATAFFFAADEPGRPEAGPSPKVILLDLKLPKVDGLELLRRLKSDARTRNIPVVVLTSSTDARDLKDAYDSGVNSYVTKPIRFDEFARIVGEVGLYWLALNKLAG